MICHKCGEKFVEGLKKCPFCGSDVLNKTEFDLPELKEQDKKIEIDDTDMNLSDNYFEVELKDKEEDENSDKYDVADLVEIENEELPKLDVQSILGNAQEETEPNKEDSSNEEEDIQEDKHEDKSINVSRVGISKEGVSNEIELPVIEAEKQEKKEETLKISGLEEKDEDKDDIDTTKEYDFSLEKTRSIQPLSDTINLSNLSLIDDINKQIEDINENSSNETLEEDKHFGVSDNHAEKEDNLSKDENKEKKNSDTNDLSTDESLKKRKNVLLITGICSLLLAVLVLLFIVFGNSGVSKTSGDYMVKLENSLQTYYETSDFQDVIEVLDMIGKDEEKISKVQEKTREYADKWVAEYIDMDIKTLGDFEDASKKYKALLSDLHANALLTSKNGTVKVLSDSDYNGLMKRLDTVYNDSSIYYVAMDYYNQNDYNRAYTTFDRIDNTNTYFSKARSYKDKIVANIMLLLETDINKIESDIDSKTSMEKLQIYTQIENVLMQYNNLYSSVNLKSQSDYQELYNEYHEKVTTYTELLTQVNDNKENSGNKENVEENSSNNLTNEENGNNFDIETN